MLNILLYENKNITEFDIMLTASSINNLRLEAKCEDVKKDDN